MNGIFVRLRYNFCRFVVCAAAGNIHCDMHLAAGVVYARQGDALVSLSLALNGLMVAANQSAWITYYIELVGDIYSWNILSFL